VHLIGMNSSPSLLVVAARLLETPSSLCSCRSWGACASLRLGSLEAPGLRVVPVPFKIPVLCSAHLLWHLTEAQLWHPRLKQDLVLPAPQSLLLRRAGLKRELGPWRSPISMRTQSWWDRAMALSFSSFWD